MDVSAFRETKKPRWVRLFTLDHLDIEVQIVPGSVPRENDPVFDRRFCSEVWLDFKNLTEADGKPVENTLEERLKLFRVAAMREALLAHVTNSNFEALAGEVDAASD